MEMPSAAQQESNSMEQLEHGSAQLMTITSDQPTFWQKAKHKTSPSLVSSGRHYWHLKQSAIPSFSLHTWYC